MFKRLILALLGALLFVGFVTSPVNAARDDHILVTGTEGQGLALRTEPSTQGGIHKRLEDNTTTNFLCFAHGELISGAQTTDVWFKVWDQRPDGSFQEGYISAAYTTTTSNELNDLQASWDIPSCGVNSQVTALPTQQYDNRADPVTYDRFAAIDWALQHAREDQPKWGGCTWFVSQALWAGGFPQVRGEWTDDDRKPYRGNAWANVFFQPWVPRTAPSKQALALWNYLQTHTSATVRELDFSVNTMPDA